MVTETTTALTETPMVTETTTAAAAPNMLTVSLVANFRLNAPGLTSITFTGFPPDTDLDPHRIILEIGKGVHLTLQSADLTLFLPCPALSTTADTECISCPRAEGPPECALVSSITVDGKEIPKTSFSTAPCLSRAGCIPDPDGNSDRLCEVVHTLDVRSLLDANSGRLGCDTDDGCAGFTVGRLGCDTDDGCAGFTVVMKKPAGLTQLLAFPRVHLSYAGTLAYAEYEAALGRLVVEELQAPFIRQPGGINPRVLAFSFQVKNFPTPRTAPSITIIGESGLVKRIGICDDQMQEGCVGPNVPSQARAIMRGGVLTSSAFPPLELATIFESSTLQATPNLLTVELRAPEEIAPGSTIRISGLLGANTPDTDQLAVTGLRIEPLAKWRRGSGTIEMTVNAAPLVQTEQVLVQFSLGNPPTAQAAQRPSVTVLGRNTYGGPSQRLACVTTPGCLGVLTGAEVPRFTS
ncbi:hypothetical protein T484DRAFT_1828990 [Baffinella frigidus]|nr:hypothetical protein T484DRAFT_1828990 [Cryptophyta sp. CCMP2293]